MSLRAFFFPEHGVLRPAAYAVVAALGVMLGLGLAAADLTQRLEWAFYDRLLRITARRSGPAPGVVVVAIDEPSFAEIGLQWPWPRALHATLIDELVRQGARTIAIDVLFDAPGASAGGDEALVDSVRRAGNVILATDRARVDDPVYSVSQWVEPFPALADAAAGLGAVRMPLDPDGVVRRADLFVDGRAALGVAAALRQPGLEPPADAAEGGRRLFRFSGAPRFGIRTVSYYQALDADHLLPEGLFRNQAVFVGRSLSAATGELSDHFPTPVAVRMAGVEIQATLFDALVRGRFIADPFGSLAGAVLLSAVLAACAALLLYRVGPIAGAATLIGAVIGLAGLSYAALAAAATRLPALTPAAVMAATYGTTAAYRFALLARERRLIKRAFQSYVAPAIVDEMLKDPSKLRLGGEEYDVTVLFSDIAGFTTVAERLSPHQLRVHLGAYFQEMLDVLLAERATLDKLIGDAIMVYFGCPVEDAHHPVQACRAALAMQRRMDVINARWSAEGLPTLRTRIGINSGRVVAGNMGTEGVFNFTVIGDCVNIASRLEGVNNAYGTLIIISEDTHARVRDAFDVRELDWIRVKGKDHPVTIYELAAEAGGLDANRRELFARFARALALYRSRQWREAAEVLGSALDIDAGDGPSRALLERCREYAAAPPDSAWDGVRVMHVK